MDEPNPELTGRGTPRQRTISPGDRRVTHGMFGHPLYKTWDGMMGRTSRPNAPAYALYGARGITVCERWQDPRHFIEDILRDLGPRPGGRSLDRIDNDGDYEPGNVRWATAREQRANQRPTPASVSVKVTEHWKTREYRTETCEQCGGSTRPALPPGAPCCASARRSARPSIAATVA